MRISYMMWITADMTNTAANNTRLFVSASAGRPDKPAGPRGPEAAEHEGEGSCPAEGSPEQAFMCVANADVTFAAQVGTSLAGPSTQMQIRSSPFWEQFPDCVPSKATTWEQFTLHSFTPQRPVEQSEKLEYWKNCDGMCWTTIPIK